MPPRRPRSATASRGRAASHQYLTGKQGERRAIILGMDYYLQLLAELNTLRALVKQHRRGSLPPARRKSRRAAAR